MSYVIKLKFHLTRRVIFPMHLSLVARAHGLWPATRQPHAALVCRLMVSTPCGLSLRPTSCMPTLPVTQKHHCILSKCYMPSALSRDNTQQVVAWHVEPGGIWAIRHNDTTNNGRLDISTTGEWAWPVWRHVSRDDARMPGMTEWILCRCDVSMSPNVNGPRPINRSRSSCSCRQLRQQENTYL